MFLYVVSGVVLLMVIVDLVDYLKEHLALGYDISQLKLHLLRYGHSARTVNDAVEVLKREALNSLPPPPLPRSISTSAGIWLVAPITVFALLFSYVLAVLL